VKQQLKQISKGNKSINKHTRSIIEKLDLVAFLESPLENEDILYIITNNLGETYKEVVDMW